MMSDAFDPYLQWLGIPPEEQPPNYYRLLGVDLYESVPAVIERAADHALLHTSMIGRDSPELERVLAAIAAAKNCLLDPHRKVAYDQQLQSGPDQDDASGNEVTVPVALKQDKARLLGDYLLLERIGVGGMGQVFRAQHRRTKEIVAVKVLPPSATRTADSIARFYREAEAATKLRHPNVVQAFSSGEQNSIHYLVMEFVDGRDLASVVKQDGPLDADKVFDYMIQAARGLAYAHEHGIVHRDVKPSNLLVDRQGVVRILDLGLARHEGPLDVDESIGPASIANTGPIMGTVDYMSPEQALDTGGVDNRADVYSLGCTMYRLLTGLLPFTGDTPKKKIQAHRLAPIPSLRLLRPDVPAELDIIFARMVAKRADDRYASMGDLTKALEECRARKEFQEGPHAAAPLPPAPPQPMTDEVAPALDPRWSYGQTAAAAPPPPSPMRSVASLRRAPPPPVPGQRTLQLPPNEWASVPSLSSLPAAPAPMPAIPAAPFSPPLPTTPTDPNLDFVPPPDTPVLAQPRHRHEVPTGLWIVAVVAALISMGAIVAIVALLMR
jgi:serine/threonine protein kinase